MLVFIADIITPAITCRTAASEAPLLAGQVIAFLWGI
jgi:hypothetical protein